MTGRIKLDQIHVEMLAKTAAPWKHIQVKIQRSVLTDEEENLLCLFKEINAAD